MKMTKGNLKKKVVAGLLKEQSLINKYRKEMAADVDLIYNVIAAMAELENTDSARKHGSSKEAFNKFIEFDNKCLALYDICTNKIDTLSDNKDDLARELGGFKELTFDRYQALFDEAQEMFKLFPDLKNLPQKVKERKLQESKSKDNIDIGQPDTPRVSGLTTFFSNSDVKRSSTPSVSGLTDSFSDSDTTRPSTPSKGASVGNSNISRAAPPQSREEYPVELERMELLRRISSDKERHQDVDSYLLKAIDVDSPLRAKVLAARQNLEIDLSKSTEEIQKSAQEAFIKLYEIENEIIQELVEKIKAGFYVEIIKDIKDKIDVLMQVDPSKYKYLVAPYVELTRVFENPDYHGSNFLNNIEDFCSWHADIMKVVRQDIPKLKSKVEGVWDNELTQIINVFIKEIQKEIDRVTEKHGAQDERVQALGDVLLELNRAKEEYETSIQRATSVSDDRLAINTINKNIEDIIQNKVVKQAGAFANAGFFKDKRVKSQEGAVNKAQPGDYSFMKGGFWIFGGSSTSDLLYKGLTAIQKSISTRLEGAKSNDAPGLPEPRSMRKP